MWRRKQHQRCGFIPSSQLLLRSSELLNLEWKQLEPLLRTRGSVGSEGLSAPGLFLYPGPLPEPSEWTKP
ncbi:hypothetical protein EYF80_019791 [Liparis tanakae]|uniref:Uncharacterized protein n=1 Tax=Liparis tanakae TaxID=230148 RepID=A0A4Z2HW60_9TELE|nr:hypothetical protein EYF80_019791 [Liparis tanakae]